MLGETKLTGRMMAFPMYGQSPEDDTNPMFWVGQIMRAHKSGCLLVRVCTPKNSKSFFDGFVASPQLFTTDVLAGVLISRAHKSLERLQELIRVARHWSPRWNHRGEPPMNPSMTQIADAELWGSTYTCMSNDEFLMLMGILEL